MNNKVKVMCFMAKSGTGKSTLINRMCEDFGIFFESVKSYSTRQPRDEFDLTTHKFVSKDYWEQNKDKAIAVYHDKAKDYYNWIDEDTFSQTKINLYAIDVVAYNKLAQNENLDVYGIFLDVDEDVRKSRIEGRGGVYSEESHLDKSLLSKDTQTVIINSNGNIDSYYSEVKRIAKSVLLGTPIHTTHIQIC